MTYNYIYTIRKVPTNLLFIYNRNSVSFIVHAVVYQQGGVEVSFNVSKGSKAVSSVDLILYRQSVSQEALVSYSNSTNCSVVLMVSVGALNIQCGTSVVLAGRDLLSNKWMSFHGLADTLHQSIQQNTASEFKLKIRAHSSCGNQLVDPRELGLFLEGEGTALLCLYSRSSGSFSVMQMKLQSALRPRRHIEMDSSGSHSYPIGFDPNAVCTLVNYNVSIQCTTIYNNILKVGIVLLYFSVHTISLTLS